MNKEEEQPVRAARKQVVLQKLRWWSTLALSETFGTAQLIFFGCMGGVPNFLDLPTHLGISMGAGIAVAMALQVFGHISGGFINPTITIGAMIFKLISIYQGMLYMVCQFIGAIIGYGLILLLVPEDSLYALGKPRNETHGFCTTVPHEKLSVVQAFFIEFLANTVLIMVCGGIWDKRGRTSYDFIALKIGVAVFGLVLAFGDYTGPSLNTARTLAPALFTGVWKDQWIYWLAPMGSAVITSYFYKFVFQTFRNPGEDQ